MTYVTGDVPPWDLDGLLGNRFGKETAGTSGASLSHLPGGGNVEQAIVALSDVLLVGVGTVTIPSIIKSITTTGYATVGDGGDAFYRRVGSEPTHPGKFQDLSGSWFERTAGEFRPQQFGGQPGDADATASIQAALDATAALGGWTRLSAGTWNASDVSHPDDVTAFGDGEGITIVRRNGAVGDGVWTLPFGSTGVRLHSLTLDGTSAAQNKAVLGLGTSFGNADIQVAVINGMQSWAVRSDPSAICSNIRLRLNMRNCPDGGFIWLPSVKGHRGLDLSGSTADGCGHNIFGIHSFDDSGDQWDTNFDVNLDNITITNCVESTVIDEFHPGPIPFETWGCTNITQRNFNVDGGVFGGLQALNPGNHMRNGVFGPGTIKNMRNFAIEAGGPTVNVSLRDIDTIDCAIYLIFDNSPDIEDFLVEGGIAIGSGLTEYDGGAGQDIVKLEEGSYKNVRIRGLTIVDPEFSRTPFQANGLDAGSTLDVDDLSILCGTAYSPVSGISVSNSPDAKVVIRNPVIRRTADIPSDHYQSAGTMQIYLPAYAAAGDGSVEVINPTLELTGARPSPIYVGGIGAIVAPQPMRRLRVFGGGATGNYSAALLIPDTSGTAQVLGFSAPGLPVSLDNSVVKRRTRLVAEGDSAPAIGTWEAGDVIKPLNPSSTGAIEWVCVASGTPGTWVKRTGLGGEPVLSGAWAPLSDYSLGPLLTAAGYTGANQIKFRCDAGHGGGGQHDLGIIIEWTGRQDNTARGGQVRLAWGTYDNLTASPNSSSMSIDGSNLASVASAVVGGKVETTVTFPTNAGTSVKVSGAVATAANYADFSGQLP